MSQEPKQAVIYTKGSTNAQKEGGTSLDTQVENCMKRAEQLGFTVVEIFRESFTGSLDRECEKLSITGEKGSCTAIDYDI